MKEKDIERGIRLVYASLESHLPYTYDNDLPEGETREFHKKAIREYADVIKILSDLL